MSSVIRTWTGKLIDLASPRIEDIDIYDIAHALAYINRFTGHTRASYTVAEHSVLCSACGAPEDALEKLMHDATEAYLGDVSSPLKSLLTEYQLLERRWMELVRQRFQLGALDSSEVKRIDHLALLAEMESKLSRAGTPIDITQHDPQSGAVLQAMRYAIRNPDGVGHKYWEQAFLNRFHELVAQRALAQIDCDLQVRIGER
ncbi:HD family hydrolase [Granulicella sp. 5B5]|uniref:HD family hydrolase n=1 Tax=Granulicella sp. 5B5 TaxID=1617967 RepID=UPI0015F5F8CA|nr:HD family hydrolase [Granulicella sp. 5B5]QMV19664.1 HD family hydrolase [Granulicella sp. 5B5]